LFSPAASASSTRTASASSTPTASASSTPFAFGARAGLVDVQGAPFDLLAVQPGDGGLSLGGVGHLHETEAPGLTGELVLDHRHGRDLPEGAEGLLEILIGNLERQITHVDIHVPSFDSCGLMSYLPFCGQPMWPGLNVNFITNAGPLSRR
jgi:hypothetical protein